MTSAAPAPRSTHQAVTLAAGSAPDEPGRHDHRRRQVRLDRQLRRRRQQLGCFLGCTAEEVTIRKTGPAAATVQNLIPNEQAEPDQRNVECRRPRRLLPVRAGRDPCGIGECRQRRVHAAQRCAGDKQPRVDEQHRLRSGHVPRQLPRAPTTGWLSTAATPTTTPRRPTAWRRSPSTTTSTSVSERATRGRPPAGLGARTPSLSRVDMRLCHISTRRSVSHH